jgi:hypothetical protein
MNVAIIGHGDNKFSQNTRSRVYKIIRRILADHPDATIISGHSPVGGIDIWAEKMAKALGYKTQIFAPKQKVWDAEYGFKQRNLDIAKHSDVIYVILVRDYPPGYYGKRFDYCYHCERFSREPYPDHVKSGACWTGWKAKEMGKDVRWIII